jgi:hypothetical protein
MGMKIGKRLLVLTLVFALVLVMSACGGEEAKAEIKKQ